MQFSTKYMGIYEPDSSFYNKMEAYYSRFLSWKELKNLLL